MSDQEAPTLGAAIDRLARRIAERSRAAPDASYTAALIARGRGHCARKFAEEAIETTLAAAEGDRAALAEEAGDALYHLLVLLLAAGVSPDDVAAALARREGVSGLAEKAARKK